MLQKHGTHMARMKKADNRGTLTAKIPIQFHIRSSKINWEIVHQNGETFFVGNAPSGQTLKSVDLGEGWELVRRYLTVRAEDEHSILEFLVAHGWFHSPEGSRRTEHLKDMEMPHGRFVLERFSRQGFATVQDYVRRMLITGNPTLPTPWHGRSTEEYKIAFADARSGSQAHVVVNGTFPSILATIQFKLVQGATFQICSRRDCQLPFEVTSCHKRRFCTQYCAHLTSLRRRRKLAGKNERQPA
jgi:hypothetical protein